MLSRTTKLLLLLLVVLSGAAYWTFESNRRAALQPAPDDVVPPGYWRRDLRRVEGTDGELERVLSLPYLQGKMEAGQTVGVVRHDPARSQPGLNLYCSGHAPEAILMDMEGDVLHRWRLPFSEAFPGQKPDAGSPYFRRVALLDDGDLLVLFQGWGLVRIDRRSNIVWSVPLVAFNDFYITAHGRVLVIDKQAGIVPEINPAEPVLEDFIVELSPDGEELRRWSLLKLFRDSDFANLLASMGERGDILHANTVTLLEHSRFDDGIFQPHRLLVSLREVDTLGILDPQTARVVWAIRGDWRRQHEPVLLESGRLLLFDNRGPHNGSARVLEVDAASGEIVWSWGETPGQQMVSAEGGSVARLANGNTLITASESGRALEVTRDGEIVWEFFTPHRAGPNSELVAALWEVIRLPDDAAPWLGDAAR